MTVLFATHNGAAKLPRMLDALCKSTTSTDRWKLVAVDNNSNDGTTALLESYRDRLPLTVLSESRQGKNHALNTGFTHLEGDLVILTDDDVIPEPDWIDRWLQVAREHPEYALFGGLILPEWETLPAAWITQWVHLGIVYTLNGEICEGPIPARLISGPNSAFRREILSSRYTVHADLGPDASLPQYAMGEDALFAMTLERQGFRAWHSRQPVVQHIVPSHYLNEKWILPRAERYALGMPLIRPELFDNRLFLFGHPLGATGKYVMLSLLKPLVEILPRTRARYRLLWNFHRTRGTVRQLRHLFSKQRPGAFGLHRLRLSSDG